MRFLICILGIVSLAGCSDDSVPAGGAGAGGGEAGGAAGDCDGATCGPAEYCGFEAPACDGPKSCQPLPAECEQKVACGCDGENYATSCDAMATTGGVSASGACTPPEGQFICNYEYQVPIYCQIGSEYCKVEPATGTYGLGCEPLPTACEEIPTDCTCLEDPCSENYCAIDDSNGAITVLCPLPP